VRQTFGTCISQENWFTNRNAGDLKVYVGRLAKCGSEESSSLAEYSISPETYIGSR
jgi:hypothetical protein